LLNTAAISTATVPIANAIKASGTAAGSPGTANQSTAQASEATRPLAAIQGFFGPAASATLPSAGERKASPSPAAAVA
jgi:hypothetical protein